MIEKFFSSPVFFAKLMAMKRGIYETVSEMDAIAAVTDEPVPKEKRDELPFAPIGRGKHWTKEKFACSVFRFTGTVPQSAKGKKVVALIKVGAEGEAYVNGEPVCAVTPILSTIDVGQPLFGKQVVPLYEKAEGGERINIELDCGNNGYVGMFFYNPRYIKADVAVVNEEKRDYYYDCLAVFLTVATSGKSKFINENGVREMKKAFNDSYALYKENKIAEARKILEPFFAEKQTEGVEYTAVGHGHLDLAWKWPIREGKRKAVRTFSNVVTNLDDYDFVFGASQAQMFEWVEQTESGLFEKIKKAVASGGIEIQGGMWTECDCNLPSGESIIRQFLYGGEYFESRFGKNSDVVWLPDAFGFPATLPQIFKGVGKKYFMTIKLHRNKYNKFPLQSFEWVAPDGSSVIAHIAPEGSYCCSASPMAFVKADVKNVQKEAGNALVIYGVSDGGGGPGEGHLEMLKRSGGKYAPKAVSGSSVSLFRKLEKKPLPRYEGELYLETHQGTLTVQAKNKFYNLLAERKMHVLEWLEAVTGDKYERRDELWKRILTNQFHDILPGSSIERVHRESVEDYAEVCALAEKAADERIKSLSGGKGFTVINPSPFAINEIVVRGGETYRAVCAPYSSCEPIKCGSPYLCAGEDYIENAFLKVTVSKTTGEITSVYDKIEKKEYAKSGVFHSLVIFSDPKSRYDAWDIERDYLTKPKKKPTLVKTSFAVIADRATIISFYVHGKTFIKQEIYVKDTKNIYFDTQTGWSETHKMLRAVFETTIYSDKANFDIQFGSIDRSTKTETSEERAMYEVCGQKYACVGDEKQGYFFVAGGSKFGYRVQDGEVSLNLLRAPTFPDENCDRGEHSFTYAVGFAPDKATVVKDAYNFVNPPLCVDEKVCIPSVYGVKAEGVITETVKCAEKGDGVVIRAYERFGKAARGSFVMPEGFVAYETDMLENGEKAVDFPIFKPHEIKTYLLKKGK